MKSPKDFFKYVNSLFKHITNILISIFFWVSIIFRGKVLRVFITFVNYVLSPISSNYKEKINVSNQSLSLYKSAYIIWRKKKNTTLIFNSYNNDKISIHNFKVTKYAVWFIESLCKTLQNTTLYFAYVKEIFVTA